MVRDELNPNHPVTREMSDNWHKMLAVYMHMQGLKELFISVDDIDAFMNSGHCNISVHPKDNVIHLRLHTDEEARALARKEGGLPY